jgi:hypothetical protein
VERGKVGKLERKNGRGLGLLKVVKLICGVKFPIGIINGRMPMHIYHPRLLTIFHILKYHDTYYKRI